MSDQPPWKDLSAWGDEARRDGMTIEQVEDGTWVVWPGHKRPKLVVCPCCEKAIPTALAAKYIANAVYPLERPS